MQPNPLPDFPLEPHEIPRHCEAPLLAPADAKIEWEGREILIRAVKIDREKWVVWLRDGEKNQIIALCREQKPIFWKQPPTPFKLQRLASSALGQNETHKNLALATVDKFWSSDEVFLLDVTPKHKSKLPREPRQIGCLERAVNCSCCGLVLLFLASAFYLIVSSIRNFVSG